MENEIYNYHANRTILDEIFIKKIFDQDERNILADLQSQYPKSIIRLYNSDLISAGYIKGLGGSVPKEWDGTIIDKNRFKKP